MSSRRGDEDAPGAPPRAGAGAGAGAMRTAEVFDVIALAREADAIFKAQERQTAGFKEVLKGLVAKPDAAVEEMFQKSEDAAAKKKEEAAAAKKEAAAAQKEANAEAKRVEQKKKELNLILGAQQLGCNVLVPDQQDRRINYDSELTTGARQALTFLQTVAHRFG